MIWIDPIVSEVREAREKIWEECNFDFDVLCKMLKNKQKPKRKREVAKTDKSRKERRF